jgi:circadian clock protein KaiC
VTNDRLLSGSPRLDSVLGGGLPRDAVNLIIGQPGTGKTMLVQQYVFANATEEHPAVYMTTASEPFDKLIRYGQDLEFFDSTAVGSAVFYEDLGRDLNRSGLPGVLQKIDSLVKERRPGAVVIDSFRALRAYAAEEEFRRFLHELAGRASAFPASHFWVGEYGVEDMSGTPEFAVADAVVSLASERQGDRTTRALEVLKLRGSDFFSGRHAYRLSAAGIDVFPRLADLDDQVYEPSYERASSGIPALDAVITAGHRAGSTTLVAGPSGTGKTLMGLHFIFNGSRQGQPGIVASLQEAKPQLEQVARGFGWSFGEEDVQIVHASPVDLYLDQWVYDLLDRAEAAGAKRILVDSLTDLTTAVGDPVRFREYVYSLTQRCAQRGIALMLTMELADLYEPQTTGDERISHLADNVILLHYARTEYGLRRLMTVLKARATDLQPTIREFRITSEGILPAEEEYPG